MKARGFLIVLSVIAAKSHPLLAGEWPQELRAYAGRTPTIDGVLSPREWADAAAFSGVRNWTHQFSPTVEDSDLSLKGYVKHDKKRLYFAFEVTDDVLYGIDTERWLPDENPQAHELTPRGFPWFGDEMELLVNADNRWEKDDSAEGNGRSWQMVCNLTKSRKGGVGAGGLLEGEPRSNPSAWETYQRWIVAGAQQAVARSKSGGKGYVIEWAVSFDPCLEVEPGRFLSPEMGDVKVGLNIALGDLDTKDIGEGNFGNFHHEEWLAGEPELRTQKRQWGTLWIMQKPRLQPERPMVLWVSTNGDDKWSGTLREPNGSRSDGPVATLAQAQRAIRGLKARGPLTRPVTVLVRAGTYYLKDPLKFTPEDSGTSECPITYAAFPGGKVVLSAGRPVTGWRHAEGDLWTAYLPEVEADGWHFRQLFVQGNRRICARHPNYEPRNPHTGGYLFVRAPRNWEGGFGACVGSIHNPGDFLEYEVRVPSEGQYTYWLYYGACNKPFGSDKMDDRTYVTVDGGNRVPLKNLPDTGDWSRFEWRACAQLSLTAGRHLLRWTNERGGGLNLDAFALCDDPSWQPKGTTLAAPDGRHLIVVQCEKFVRAQGKQMTVDKFVDASGTLVHFDPGALHAWPKSPDKVLHIFIYEGGLCSNTLAPIASIEEGQSVLRTARRIADYRAEVGARFFVDNVFEALDAPGEWYLDKASGTLYYWPVEREFPKVQVVAPALQSLVELNGDAKNHEPVQYVAFRGFTFEATDYDFQKQDWYHSESAAVWLREASHCTFSDCRFVNLGGSALVGYGRCTHNSFLRNEVAYCGAGAVTLNSNPNNQHLGDAADYWLAAYNRVSGNHIHHTGLIWKHGNPLCLNSAVHNVISHNSIHDVPRMGTCVTASAGGNLLEFNEVRRTNLETGDSGGIYFYNTDRAKEGNIVYNNLVADVIGMGTTEDGKIVTPNYTWGIYIDGESSKTTVRSNLVYRNVLGGVFINGGHGNAVENNVLVDGSARQVMYSNYSQRGVGNVFRRNLIAYPNPEAVLGLGDQPDTAHLASDWNLFWHNGLAVPELDNLRGRGFETHSVVADPLFVNPAKDDYRLRPDSPAFQLGFRPVDTRRIGPEGFPAQDMD